MKYLVFLLFFLPLFTFAQDFSDTGLASFDEPQEAKVQSIIETTYPIVFGAEIEFQQLRVLFENGEESSQVFNDYTPVKVGDVVYVTPGYDPETQNEGFFVREIDRTNSLLVVFLLFVVAYVAIAGMRGIRSLIALAIAIGSVWFVLIPAMIAGYNPLVVGIGMSVLILGLAIFITHGVRVVSFASYIGSLLAIVVTILFAQFAVGLARVSGLVGDESSTISVLYGGVIDLQGLLLAAMIIGILGVLDDVAIVQAAMVREFMTDKTLSMWDIFCKAMRVGQEHAAALVNTLVLAYTAVALPLFLIVLAPTNSYIQGDMPFAMQISNELFVTEFIRSVVGSFGLVITIPIVTLLSIYLFKKFPDAPGSKHVHAHHPH